MLFVDYVNNVNAVKFTTYLGMTASSIPVK